MYIKKTVLFISIIIVLISCKKDSKLESKIANVDIDLQVERFDKVYAKAKPSDLAQIKETFPFLFSKRIADSVWINRMNDTLQTLLYNEVDKIFGDLNAVNADVKSLFQHIKYYDKSFKPPRIVTLTNDVDYRNSVIVTDTIVLIALDNYLGKDHEFYGSIQSYLKQNFEPSLIVCDLAEEYAKKYAFQSKRRTLLDEMIYFGKLLYFKESVIPFKSEAEIIGYTDNQIQWSIANESEIWSYFIEKELLYSTDSKLPSRFISPAPFSKFYLELDNESPGRLGQYIGWQIVKKYMKDNDVSLMDMMQKEAKEIFDNTKYKPRK